MLLFQYIYDLPGYGYPPDASKPQLNTRYSTNALYVKDYRFTRAPAPPIMASTSCLGRFQFSVEKA